jgi:site-specific recombinase XerD
VSALRVLFRFWYEEHLTEENLEDLLKGYSWRNKEKIPSFYSLEEVRLMENSICRSSNVGKRNYAMLLLASRLGLRASDIAGLQFFSLDWEKNEIRLKQYKTGDPLSLPLLAEVGNAIIDYLKNGRPQSPVQNVFLSSRAPYVPVSKNCVCSAITSVITQSGVSTKGKHHGPHSLRHSLAGCMLGQGSSLPVISEILGHRTTETTMVYLRIDLDSLGKCALPVRQVPDSFYMQKGGLFYE